MSQNLNLLSLSRLEDACGHLVFKNVAFQASHFPCLCIKRNRWRKPQGEKANKIQSPLIPAFPMVPSNSRWSANSISKGPAFCVWSDTARADSDPLCNVWRNELLEVFYFWTFSSTGCWVTFMPIVCSLLGGKCWLFCTFQSIQFCGHKTFSSCLTQYTKTFLLSQNYWTSASEELAKV